MCSEIFFSRPPCGKGPRLCSLGAMASKVANSLGMEGFFEIGRSRSTITEVRDAIR